MLKQLMDKDKTNLSAYYDAYRLFVGLRRLPEAETVLKSAIRNNPKDTALRLELARFYFGTKRTDDLLGLLKEMKANLKDFPNAYIQSGDFFVRVNQFDDAIKQYEEGIQKDPEKKNTYLKHEIEAYIRQNKLELAMAKNEEILKNDPKDPEAKGLKATFMLDQGQVTQAMTDLQSVVTAKPGNFVARFNLGRAHFHAANSNRPVRSSTKLSKSVPTIFRRASLRLRSPSSAAISKPPSVSRTRFSGSRPTPFRAGS